jgi:hypothetical protein
MDVAWQDGAGSFLDWSGSDLSGSFASLGSGDGSVLWSSSADTPLFSGDSVLWESSADSPAGSHLSAFDPSASDTDGTPTSSWITSGTSGPLVGSASLDSGLLWAGVGDTGSSSLLTNAGGAQFDLAAGSGSSQWQQLLGVSGNQPTWFQEATHLVWTAGSIQPLAPPVTPDSLHLASSVATPIFPAIGPEHILWTDPSAATGLLAGPSLVDVAPPTPISGAGIISQSTSGLPLTGAGSR